LEIKDKLFFGLMFLLNSVRFLWLDFSPPGFYIDEAVGATHVMCIKETGADFFNQTLPLFSAGFGGGFYTAPYLYGEVFFTSLFGNSVFAFRAFIALVSFLTIGLIYLWVRKATDERTGRFALLFATISPWAFQFSRIAWDPPLSPFFLILGLVAFQSKKKWSLIGGALCFAVAAYAYPPARIQAAVFLFLIPDLNWKEKAKSFAVWMVALVPLFYRSLDPAFTARGRMLVLWSGYPGNPYHNEDLFGFVGAFFVLLGKYFTPDFLLLSGDHNVRHSIQDFGMISYVEAAAIVSGLLIWAWHLKSKKSYFSSPQKNFMLLCAVGLLTGLAPGALTWEGNPHALRALGAWPFFSVLAAIFAERICRPIKWMKEGVLVASLVFISFYFYSYFEYYPVRAHGWFEVDSQPLSQAYSKMTEKGMSCESLRH
jgi:hypothetical protein